jgi:hypothetical protein
MRSCNIGELESHAQLAAVGRCLLVLYTIVTVVWVPRIIPGDSATSVVNCIEPNCLPVQCLYSHYIRIKVIIYFVTASCTFFFFFFLFPS